ncbi:hypothetical protein, partial [Escherichia coli]|uniref:hypothetical protein n=1 Tax=Escherichia coli TaxID=562 RepID=UPI00195F7DFA
DKKIMAFLLLRLYCLYWHEKDTDEAMEKSLEKHNRTNCLQWLPPDTIKTTSSHHFTHFDGIHRAD